MLTEMVQERAQRALRAAVALEMRKERAVLAAALQESEQRNIRDLPKFEKASAETLARLRKAEFETEAARGPAIQAEAALISEKTRASRVRESLREKIFELAEPRLAEVYRGALRRLRDFRFAWVDGPQTQPVRSTFGKILGHEVVPGSNIPKRPEARAREALEALRTAMEMGEQDAPAIEAVFFAAVPGDFAAAIRNEIGPA